MQALYERFVITMTLEQARNASHQGDCTADVQELCQHPLIRRQLKKISDDDLDAELRGTGAWEAEELKGRATNEERIIWIAAGNIQEEHTLKRGGRRI